MSLQPLSQILSTKIFIVFSCNFKDLFWLRTLPVCTSPFRSTCSVTRENPEINYRIRKKILSAEESYLKT